MPYYLLPVPFSIGLISAYLVARNRNDLKRTAIIQPLTTLLSLVVAALSLFSPNANTQYTV